MTNDRPAEDIPAAASPPNKNATEPVGTEPGNDDQANIEKFWTPPLQPIQKITHPASPHAELDLPMTQPDEPQDKAPIVITDQEKQIPNDTVQDMQPIIPNESGWIKVTKTVKRKQPLISAEAPEPQKPTIQDRIKQRGEEAIDVEKRLITPVKLDFYTKNRTNINIRNEFLKVFNKMKEVDPTLAILTDTAVWTTDADIPVGNKFLQQFKVIQPTAPRKLTTVSVYFTCESKLPLNVIKFNPIVWAVVGIEGTYLVPDKFQTEQTACPGFLINVHHKLVWKDTLLAQLREALRSVRVDVSNKVVQRWRQQNPTATTNQVPFFTLKMSVKKMGSVSAPVYNIISARKDAELLKMMFSKLGEGPVAPRWIFVPTGLHLIATAELVQASLRHQNEYINGITAIAVEGITEEVMTTGGCMGGSVELDINSNCMGLESIERTTLLSQRGRWLLVVKKQHQDAIRKYLMKHLFPYLEKTGQCDVQGVPPCIAGGLIGPTTVGNYAAVLTSNLTSNAKSPPDESLNRSNQNKRRHVIPVVTCEKINTHATKPKRTEKSNSHTTRTPSEQTISTMSSTPNTATKPPSQDKFTQWEKQMEEKISARLQQFETAQQQKFNEFTEQMQRSITNLLDTATEKFQQGIQPQLDQMTNSMAQLQTVVLERLNSLTIPSPPTLTNFTSVAKPSISPAPMQYAPTYHVPPHPKLTSNETSPAPMACSSPGDKST